VLDAGTRDGEPDAHRHQLVRDEPDALEQSARLSSSGPVADALRELPFFIARRATVTRVSQIVIP
jgi:hypothetical protein